MKGSDTELLEALPAALAARSPHALPPGLRARVLAAAGTPSRVRRPAWLALGAAGVLAVVALVAWNLALTQALAQDRTLLAQLRDVSAGQDTIFEIVDAPTTQKLVLRAVSGGGPSAPYAKVYWRPDQTHVVAMAGRLPGGTYDLYLDGERAGAIVADATGFGYLVVDTGRRGLAYRSARLVAQPGGTVIVAGER